MSEKVRIVGLEEHVALPVVLDAWARVGVPQIPQLGYGDEPFAQRLRDVAERRLADMDDQGVDVQVLSLASPGVQNLAAEDAVTVAREANDALAEVVDGHPERFQALAAIPTPAPEAAAAELERAVTQLGFRGAMLYGRTGTMLADAPEFDDLYGEASRLRVPLHFHPQTPVRQVQEAYYSGLDNGVGYALATAGLVLRLGRAVSADDLLRRVRPPPRAAGDRGALGRGRPLLPRPHWDHADYGQAGAAPRRLLPPELLGDGQRYGE